MKNARRPFPATRDYDYSRNRRRPGRSQNASAPAGPMHPPDIYGTPFSAASPGTGGGFFYRVLLRVFFQISAKMVLFRWE